MEISLRDTEEKCKYSSFPFGLPVAGDTFKLLPCVLRKENIGEVARSDGGVEMLLYSVF